LSRDNKKPAAAGLFKDGVPPGRTASHDELRKGWLTVFAVAKDAVASSVVLSAWYSALNASNATLDRWTSNVVFRTLDDDRERRR